MNYFYLASTSDYSSGAYGAGQYSEQGTITSTEVSENAANTLPETGVPVIASISGGVLLIVVGAVLLVKMHRKNK